MINNMQAKRKFKKLTQQQLAESVGVTQEQISHYESGRQTPPPAKAKLIAEVLGMDWTEFYQ